MAEYPVEYNGTIATGGDSLHDDLNIFYSVCGATLLRAQWRIQAHSPISLVISDGLSFHQPWCCS